MIETFCILSLMVWIGVFICEAFKGTGKASSSPSVRCVKTLRTAEKTAKPLFAYDRKRQKKVKRRHREYAKWKKTDPEKWNKYRQFLRDSDSRYDEAKAGGEDMKAFWEEERTRRDEFEKMMKETEN